MGVVYQAEHRHMERIVALKVLGRDLTTNPLALERFRREAKAAARLTHPNIVTAHDFDQAGDLHFLVMEYVEGVSLSRLVETRGPLPVANACHYVRQAAFGLQHAHEQGMVHRDIKPHNLMLTPRGQVKVLDFGLARLAEERRRTGYHAAGPEQRSPGRALTAFGSMLGTPDYIAPEQISDSHRADIRADLYSLGCTLYFLLTGRPPFPGGSVLEKAQSHLDTPPERVNVLRPDLPLELTTVLDRMMAKDPAQRYQTPKEVVAALAPFSRATPQPVAALTPVPATPGQATVSPRPAVLTLAARGRRHRLPLLVLAAACLVVAGGLTVFLTQHTPPPASPRLVPPALTGQILYILPPHRFWFQDYENVKEALEERHLRMRTASAEKQASHDPYGKGRKEDAHDLTVDHLLGDVNVAQFDAVVVGGGDGVMEYMRGGRYHAGVARVIAAIYEGHKPVGAICMGPAVLAEVQVEGKSLLAGRRVTAFAKDAVYRRLDEAGAKRVNEALVVDGPVLTARDWNDAQALVKELVAALGRTDMPKSSK
jgi:putative intracellular protease/amidase